MNHTVHRRDIIAQQPRSPRQIAKKAYNTASKKISLDNRRKRQQYHMRERLLIQNTMMKAEMMLNNQSSELPICKVVLSDPFDNIKTPLCHNQVRYYPPPPPLSTLEQSAPSQFIDLQPTAVTSTVNATAIAVVTDPSPLPFFQVPLPAVNATIQKSSTLSIRPFQFLHNIFGYLRLPFFDLWRLYPFISWSTLFFSKRDRGSCLHSSTRISITANFTQK